MNTLPPFFLGAFSCSHWLKRSPVSSTTTSVPFGCEKFVALRRHRLVLQFPKHIRVGEIAVLSEQVAHDLTCIFLKREQRGFGRDKLAAEKPSLELITEGDVFVLGLKQFQPCLLLGFGRHREMAQRLAVDLVGTVSVPNLGKQITEREALLDHDLGQAEGRRDVGDAAAFLNETGEGFVLGHFIGVTTGDVFDERSLNRRRVVALLHYRARNGRDLLAFRFDRFGGEVPPPSGDDLEAAGVAPNEKGLQDSALSNARQDVRNIGRFPAVPHVERGYMKLIEGDKLKFHFLSP